MSIYKQPQCRYLCLNSQYICDTIVVISSKLIREVYIYRQFLILHSLTKEHTYTYDKNNKLSIELSQSQLFLLSSYTSREKKRSNKHLKNNLNEKKTTSTISTTTKRVIKEQKNGLWIFFYFVYFIRFLCYCWRNLDDML